jgi:hypothetical protein
MRIRYRILSICIVIALFLVAMPAVSAYTISVTGITTSPFVSGEKQSFPSGSQWYKIPSRSVALPYSGQMSDYSGSVGSVKAYTDNMIQNENEAIRFSESVSVSGFIKEFHYSAHYKS